MAGVVVMLLLLLLFVVAVVVVLERGSLGFVRIFDTRTMQTQDMFCETCGQTWRVRAINSGTGASRI